MPTSFIVVDDFLENPDGFRQQALALTYPEQDEPYPGRNSLQRMELPGLSEHISHIVGERLRPIEPLESHAKCRLALGNDKRRGDIHVDTSQWSGILYLTPDEACKGGTEFYRHKRTGLERAAITDEEAHRMGFAGRDQLLEDTINRDGNRYAAWTKTMEIPMRFNRLVLLRPWLFHTAGPSFGKTPEQGRLVYLMFFTLA